MNCFHPYYFHSQILTLSGQSPAVFEQLVKFVALPWDSTIISFLYSLLLSILPVIALYCLWLFKSFSQKPVWYCCHLSLSFGRNSCKLYGTLITTFLHHFAITKNLATIKGQVRFIIPIEFFHSHQSQQPFIQYSLHFIHAWTRVVKYSNGWCSKNAKHGRQSYLQWIEVPPLSLVGPPPLWVYVISFAYSFSVRSTTTTIFGSMRVNVFTRIKFLI